MRNYLISLNQFADFTIATERGKIRIVRQQLSPNPFRIHWYALAKARIKKSLQNQGDLVPIYQALEILKKRIPKNRREISDKENSVLALNRYLGMRLPKIFIEKNYSILKPVIRTTEVGNLTIIVAPDVVIKANIDGRIVLGAIKIHVSKSKPFDYSQSKKISAILYKYLNEIKKESEIVEPKLCFSLDVFSDRIVSAPVNIEEALLEIEKSCEEIRAIWKSF